MIQWSQGKENMVYRGRVLIHLAMQMYRNMLLRVWKLIKIKMLAIELQHKIRASLKKNCRKFQKKKLVLTNPRLILVYNSENQKPQKSWGLMKIIIRNMIKMIMARNSMIITMASSMITIMASNMIIIMINNKKHMIQNREIILRKHSFKIMVMNIKAIITQLWWNQKHTQQIPKIHKVSKWVMEIQTLMFSTICNQTLHTWTKVDRMICHHREPTMEKANRMISNHNITNLMVMATTMLIINPKLHTLAKLIQIIGQTFQLTWFQMEPM